MKIKVCGMRDSKNIQELSQLMPDFMGFIFYQKSKRYVGNMLDINLLNQLASTINKVGVFVNDTEASVIANVKKYNLDYVQLHGYETVAFCQNLKAEGIKIIKAFSVSDSFDFQITNQFENVANYFLFDTATPQKGGSGISFDWRILENYIGDTPFLLAGGIDEHNLATAKKINHKALFGLDLNSRFELEPGLKDIQKLKKVIIPTKQ
jgi:phosphoribosylanthranilate isomerase